jgi:hypothetical protein
MTATNRTLADRYAEAKLAADAANAALAALRKEILDSGREVFVGDDHNVVVVLEERSTLDTAIVRKELTPAQIAKATKVSLVTKLHVVELLRVAA